MQFRASSLNRVRAHGQSTMCNIMLARRQDLKIGFHKGGMVARGGGERWGLRWGDQGDVTIGALKGEGHDKA